ncbi:His-Xaa-Ser system protein HxsD [Pseudomonas syringae]|uniref:His-Xaa-Ser system protein HxsD n=2 Tax=Pseudomonas TaxID=286 RepID=A0A6B2ASN1_PSESX|nr:MULTISPECIES: His-Xaa-Ser system protein HxsD [Pseudomonas]MBI6557944.1 His-Xaa-Ser system protein HxsD [Pseudomonas syringae]MBI6573198.1 His-Xaa-Ser system protein HxsD [Pseudomonas syringae]MBI6587813.1 His-Xaa-Ser system protein HxsD [Pseudomonas syringae]MBI6595678.1 His-Xaa-Ser system protein HxsD [Pseudomonas syringae]MCK9702120.1 His-Xaa-Ser system protein HxsD [Pseudomonas syringae pv. syringae]
MTWPVTLKLDSPAYPLSVVQRAAYSLADIVAIQVSIETNQISLTAHPAEARLALSPEQAHSLILQHLNDFALRDHINRETTELREILARAALAGCGVSQ